MDILPPYLEKVHLLKDPDIGKGTILDVFVMKIKELIQGKSIGAAIIYLKII